jgi:oxygen-independent coproporphyrinogen-3 oxidase
MILQLKTGRLDAGYFRKKYSVEITDEFRDGFESLAAEGYASIEEDQVTLSRQGLLRVDSLLPRFFEPQFQGVRYT